MANETLAGVILSMCARIKDGRTPHQVLGKQMEEMGELATEVNIKAGYLKRAPGKDGVVGEGIDVLITCIDQIYQNNPGITEEELIAVAHRKLGKWFGYYSNNYDTTKDLTGTK